jgi:hypothetical protein
MNTIPQTVTRTDVSSISPARQIVPTPSVTVARSPMKNLVTNEIVVAA